MYCQEGKVNYEMSQVENIKATMINYSLGHGALVSLGGLMVFPRYLYKHAFVWIHNLVN